MARAAVTLSQIDSPFPRHAIQFIAPAFSLTSLVSIGLPFFLVTMASQNAPGNRHDESVGLSAGGISTDDRNSGLALLLSPFGVYSIYVQPLPQPFARARMRIGCQ